ncbi:MAG: ribose-5-phosphate isomerase RpiA [Dongiaceae bacterium]
MTQSRHPQPKRPQAKDIQETEKMLVGEMAAEMIEPGMVIGLGTGSTVRHFANALGRRIKAGLPVTAIATSRQSEMLAQQNNIRLTNFDRVSTLDICVDGADEVSPDFDMIKGGGGALLYEKIVAAAARRRVYMADSTKLVAKLGAFPLPVEVCQFGHQTVLAHLTQLAPGCGLRLSAGQPIVTDAGNYIIDCRFGTIDDPQALNRRLQDIPGVVESGLFIGMIGQLITIRDGQPAILTQKEQPFWR